MCTVIVCGGRDFQDKEFVDGCLDKFHKNFPISLLLQGGASGADNLARKWAEARNVPCETYQADWKKEGRAAGPKRNQRMLDLGRPNVVIAMPGGRGTEDMKERAERAGVPVVVFYRPEH